jgi:RNA:NAD 2'-phosphotransferase (TPT1/KptA family)
VEELDGEPDFMDDDQNVLGGEPGPADAQGSEMLDEEPDFIDDGQNQQGGVPEPADVPSNSIGGKVAHLVVMGLRHGKHGVTPDEHGWASLVHLRSRLRSLDWVMTQHPNMSLDMLTVWSQGRLQVEGTYVRSIRGHTLAYVLPPLVKIEMADLPNVLYHCTTRHAADAILKVGLKTGAALGRCGRPYVYLSTEPSLKPSRPVCLSVAPRVAAKQGCNFYWSGGTVEPGSEGYVIMCDATIPKGAITCTADDYVT